jgi:hypothetical protein
MLIDRLGQMRCRNRDGVRTVSLWTVAAVAAFWGLLFLVDFVADVQFEKALLMVIRLGGFVRRHRAHLPSGI